MSHVPTQQTSLASVLVRGWMLLTAFAFSASAAAQPNAVPTLAPMIERISPSVVNIAVKTSISSTVQDELLRRYLDVPPEVEGAGSGVIVDAMNGYILTNHHVIANADEITVTLLENRSFAARVVGSDEASDLAVLQIEATSLTSVPFGDSAKVRVGDYVVAIGNPFGFSNTVTSGIVSALGRSGLDNDAFEDFIQTDASINPGNSGGALVNLNGELVGISSAIISRTGGNVGIGFAIPVNMARAVMDQLIATGSVRRGLLGVVIQDITPEIADVLGLSGNSGALVSKINENSAAEKAGIRIEDVIVTINGTRLRTSGSLKNAIGLLPPGEQVTVGLIRDGREQTVTATLGELAPPSARTATPPRVEQPAFDSVFEGVDLVVNESSSGAPGLLVTRIDPDSPAGRSGLRPGDVITKINRVPVRTLADAVPVVEHARAVLLEIQRAERSELIVLR
ncbi:MAG TPA: Do family serine endopeptidase [Gammaproteobacteria bacterium]